MLLWCLLPCVRGLLRWHRKDWMHWAEQWVECTMCYERLGVSTVPHCFYVVVHLISVLSMYFLCISGLSYFLCGSYQVFVILGVISKWLMYSSYFLQGYPLRLSQWCLQPSRDPWHNTTVVQKYYCIFSPRAVWSSAIYIPGGDRRCKDPLCTTKKRWSIRSDQNCISYWNEYWKQNPGMMWTKCNQQDTLQLYTYRLAKMGTSLLMDTLAIPHFHLIRETKL